MLKRGTEKWPLSEMQENGIADWILHSDSLKWKKMWLNTIYRNFIIAYNFGEGQLSADEASVRLSARSDADNDKS